MTLAQRLQACYDDWRASRPGFLERHDIDIYLLDCMIIYDGDVGRAITQYVVWQLEGGIYGARRRQTRDFGLWTL